MKNQLLVVQIGDAEEIMTYNAVIDGINRQIQRELNQTPEERVWIFKDIISHRKTKDKKHEVLVKWEDDQETWEPLKVIAKDDPVTCARYAMDNDLLDVPGWKRFRRYQKLNAKTMSRLIRQNKLRSKREGPKIKFGVRVPMNHKEAMKLDRENGDNQWANATKEEMDKIYEFETFESLGRNATVPRNHQKIKTWLIYDVKQDGRRRARLVCGGHMTDPSNDAYYSSVASLRSVRIAVLLGELNDLDVWVGDIKSAYLTSRTSEQVVFYAGPEFASHGHEGHLMKVVGACYGLRDSGARFHERLSDVLHQEGFVPSKADRDLWMKDCGDHYEYICTYVDDLLFVGKDPEMFFKRLREIHKFQLNGVGEPKYHLGGDFHRAVKPEPILTWGSKTYIRRMLANYKNIFHEEVKKKKVYSPLERGDHPELDESEFCDELNKKHYLCMVGELQWAVTLGRFDIMCAVNAMSRYRPQPRVGHMDRLKRMYQYLNTYPETSIKFNTEIPDYSMYEKIAKPSDWGWVYHPCTEEIPVDAPVPKGKPVRHTVFCDANLMANVVNGKSNIGVLHMINKTPIEWYSKSTSTVETSTYGTEFCAARTAVDQIVDIRYSLRMLGVPILDDEASWMFGDNLSVVNSSTVLHYQEES